VRAGLYPERATPHRRPPGINKFQEFLLRRWGEGWHNATKLWHEIQDQGYTGGRSTMAKFIATLRVPGTTYFRPTAEPAEFGSPYLLVLACPTVRLAYRLLLLRRGARTFQDTGERTHRGRGPANQSEEKN
jgi:hypothetical protein